MYYDLDVPAPPRPDPPAHVMRITIAGRIVDARWANVFWARNGAGIVPTDTELLDAAKYFLDQYYARFRGLVSGAYGIDRCDLTYYGPAGLQHGAEHIEERSGSAPGDGLPANVALCVSWKIQQRYRGGHPRTYLPPGNTDMLGNGSTWSDGTITSARNSANQFHSDVNALTSSSLSDVHLGTVSFVLRKEWRSPPVFRDYTPTAATVDGRVDTMRRRLGPDR